MTTKDDQSVLERVEQYLDAVPRSAADAEQLNKFTLFRSRAPWPYYARPRLGMNEPITFRDVDQLRDRQRELRVPQSIEWVIETTPSLRAAAALSGLKLVEYPLLVFEAVETPDLAPPAGVTIRLVDADDPDFTRVHAVAHVGFGAEGTQVGPQGVAERDAAAAETKQDRNDFARERARSGYSVSYAAFDETGPISVGTHQPVDGATELVGIATLPIARRRGIAAALTAALVADAQRRGCTTIFLSAGSDDVARVYERAGFRRIGHAGAAEAP
jgi:ribosomal protein S18 acetylase RimI-like enzyme